MNMIEQIKVDREAGTPGPWVKDSGECMKVKDASGSIAMLMQTHLRGRRTAEEVVSNAARIARVPDMEAALIAADELADAADAIVALEDNTSPFGGELQADRIERAHDRFTASIAAYRAAIGAT